MAIEAELKAVVRDPETLLRLLEDRYGVGRAEVYRDTYYDAPDGSLTGRTGNCGSAPCTGRTTPAPS